MYLEPKQKITHYEWNFQPEELKRLDDLLTELLNLANISEDNKEFANMLKQEIRLCK